MSKNRQKAEQLASQAYFVLVERDETTEGAPVYIGSIMELPGCIGQGDTFGAALADTNSAKVDYIESLLNDGLPVPEPLTSISSVGAALYQKSGETKKVASLDKQLDPSIALLPQTA